MIFRVRRSFCIQLLQTKIRSFAFIKPRAHNKMFAHRRISTVCSCTFPKQIELFFSLIISYSPALHKQNIPGYNKKAPTNVSAFSLEVTPGFEPGNQGFADPCLTTWLCRQNNGAGDEARTRYLHLGKVALYQMSYARKWCLRPESNWRHADFQSAALPTELPRHIKPLLQPDEWRPGRGSNPRPPA